MFDSEIIKKKLEKLEKIQDLKIDPYGKKFEKKDKISNINKENMHIQTAGRIVINRQHGKISFGKLQDITGKIQFCVRADYVDNYDFYQNIGLGDIIGITGITFYTKTNELTIKVKKFVLLSKNLQPLPEKYHGLSDVDLRYRNRHIDLVVNEESKKIFLLRSKMIKFIREYLYELNYDEVETPMMHSVAGGAIAKPFKTFHESLGENLYLRIAPELYLKKLIIGGYEKIFELNRNFRNEGISTKHNPEFTSLEIYNAYTDYNYMMNLNQSLIENLIKKLNISCNINEIEWKKFKMIDIVYKYTNCNSIEELKKFAKKNNLKTNSDDEVITKIFEEYVEENLKNPTIIYDFPISDSPLAQKTSDKKFAERFELFIDGKEISNGYTELNDPIEQKKRFSSNVDDDFVKALEFGMPPTSGLGIGIDRLLMVLTKQSSIKDTIFFPTLKSIKI